MLELRICNQNDAEAEYLVLRDLPPDENGFKNRCHGIDEETFMRDILPQLIDYTNTEYLKPGHVPQAFYFLWEDDHIVGLFKFRIYLHEGLRNGAGHIGYGILPAYRGKGYAKKGLAMMIDIAKTVIPEDEIYMSADKNNPASIHVQLANGAYIHHEDAKEVYTRIPLRLKYACIWDLDGTLLDSYAVILDSLQATLQSHGCTYEREYLENYVTVKSVHAFLEEFCHMQGLDFEIVFKEYTARQDSGNRRIKLMEHAKETLSALVSMGIENYVYTHKGHTAQEVLEQLDIAQFIRYTVDGDAGYPKKPDPTALLYIAKRFGLNVHTCTYIGDRRLDEEAGKNAGMNRILYLREGTPVEPLFADTAVIRDLHELSDRFAKALTNGQ